MEIAGRLLRCPYFVAGRNIIQETCHCLHAALSVIRSKHTVLGVEQNLFLFIYSLFLSLYSKRSHSNNNRRLIGMGIAWYPNMGMSGDVD
jgi:hypothetical protein